MYFMLYKKIIFVVTANTSDILNKFKEGKNVSMFPIIQEFFFGECNSILYPLPNCKDAALVLWKFLMKMFYVLWRVKVTWAFFFAKV